MIYFNVGIACDVIVLVCMHRCVCKACLRVCYDMHCDVMRRLRVICVTYACNVMYAMHACNVLYVAYICIICDVCILYKVCLRCM